MTTETTPTQANPYAGHTPGPWKPGEPPRDGRLYIAIGRIVGSGDGYGYSFPFLSRVRWGGRDGWTGWTNEQGLAISSDIEDRVLIDHWCAATANVEGNT